MKFHFLFPRPVNFPGIIAALIIVILTTGSLTQGLDEKGNSNPVPTRTYKPDYPENLRNQGITGNAVIKFTINKQGSVVDPEVVSATHEAFGAASMDAIRQWQFLPARKNGKIVSKQVQLPFNFTLTLEEKLTNRIGREVFTKVRGKIYKADKLDTSPAPINTVSPVYPDELKDSGIEGEAQVKFIINKEGLVMNPKIVSTDHEKFGPSALMASLTLKFDPVELKGKRINVEMERSFTFSE